MVLKRVSLGHNFNSCAVVRLVIITIFVVHLLTTYFLKLLNDKLLRPRLIFLFPLGTSGSIVKLPKIMSEEICVLTKNVYLGFFVISFCVFADLDFLVINLKCERDESQLKNMFYCSYTVSFVHPGRIPNEKYSSLVYDT